MNRLKILFTFVCIAVLSSCDKKIDMLIPCEPLPIIDSHKTIKTKEGINLRLPEYADVRRRRDEEWGCNYAGNLFIDYLWYEGELISEGINRFKVQREKAVKVVLSVEGSGNLEEARRSYRAAAAANGRSWRNDSALPHKRFPLEYYPKLYWDNPDAPSVEALKRERLDSYWGITNTKYKNVYSGRHFGAFCSIPPLDKSDLSSRVESDFERFGLGGCRGYISAAKAGKYLGATIIVKPFSGTKQEGMVEINLIYDAAVEKLQSFIVE